MIEPTVLFEDEQILVVNKPAGLLVHADGKPIRKNADGKEIIHPTLVDWLLENYPEVAGVGEVQTLANGTVIERPGIVHRLDRETSGVIVVAKTQDAFESLKEQFGEREARKVYRAFVHGIIKDDRGVIDKPIGNSRGGTGPRTVKNPHGELRDALTTFRVISRKAGIGEAGVSYVEIFPKTGRTHQIRVHFSSIQRPVICDKLYAPRREHLLGFQRLALHAFSLTLQHPDGEDMTFEAPLPPDFLEAERQIAQ